MGFFRHFAFSHQDVLQFKGRLDMDRITDEKGFIEAALKLLLNETKKITTMLEAPGLYIKTIGLETWADELASWPAAKVKRITELKSDDFSIRDFDQVLDPKLSFPTVWICACGPH